jgi:hypothetical protein
MIGTTLSTLLCVIQMHTNIKVNCVHFPVLTKIKIKYDIIIPKYKLMNFITISDKK